MAEEKELFLIDVDKIISEKAGDKAKFIPKFVNNWLKKILHQEDVNAFIGGDAAGKVGIDFLDACIEYLDMKMEVFGLDELPPNEDGKFFTFTSNHPLGGADGVALGQILCHKYDSKVKYLVNDVLMNLHGLAPRCVPVNKTGSQSRNLPQMVDTAFKSENNVLMFPAGLCSRKIDGVIQDLPWKKTFISKSVEYHRDVISVRFSGHNSEKFYNIANICKKFHIKFNLAMLFLVDEMYKNRGKKMTVTFGKPISWQTFDKSKTPAQWAQWVRDKVYEL